jgi:hypothetical protein
MYAPSAGSRRVLKGCFSKVHKGVGPGTFLARFYFHFLAVRINP